MLVAWFATDVGARASAAGGLGLRFVFWCRGAPSAHNVLLTAAACTPETLRPPLAEP